MQSRSCTLQQGGHICRPATETLPILPTDQSQPRLLSCCRGFPNRRPDSTDKEKKRKKISILRRLDGGGHFFKDYFNLIEKKISVKTQGNIQF